MKITESQLELLRSLKCERLSSNTANFSLINDFYNTRNNSLVDTLQGDAYDDDENNRIAYYIVKTVDDKILFFFSLKCGLLYDEFIEGDRLKEIKSFYDTILRMSLDETQSVENKKAIASILESVRSKKGIKKEDVARVLHLSVDSDEFSKIFSKNLKNVGRTFPGVELVHFCANDAHREEWDEYDLPQNMGTTIFWYFIVPKILEMLKIVGCEYVFLFAADLTPYEELIRYYSDQLKFEKADEHCVAIPMYDFTCQFMSQKTCELEGKRKQFFEEFNIKPLYQGAPACLYSNEKKSVS